MSAFITGLQLIEYKQVVQTVGKTTEYSFALLGVHCSPSQDCAIAASFTSSSEVGSLFPAQHYSSDTSYVYVCIASSLDGLHLVCHWKEGDGKKTI